MAIFRVPIDRGIYIIKGNRERRLDETTNFIIVADDKESASMIVKKFLGDKVSQITPRSPHAVFDELSELLERWQPSSNYKKVIDIIEEARDFIGSVKIDGVVILSPENDDDMLIVSLSEEQKERVMLEELVAMDEGPQWGNDRHELTLLAFTKAVQLMF